MFLIFQTIQRLISRIALAAVCAAILAGPACAQRSKYPFRLEEIKRGRDIELIAHNRGPATITVYLIVEGENAASNVAWPIARAMPPFSSLKLANVFPEDPKKSMQVHFTSGNQFGDFRAVHSPDVHYRLPYRAGEAHRIMQAYGDPLTSYIGHHAQHAIDFAMPEGTPIVATRDGVVVYVRSHFDAGGMDLDLRDKKNAVVIQHDDTTVAHYTQLAIRASPVNVGQHVTAGTVIGYAGGMRDASGGQLHYEVTKPELLADGRVEHLALPVKFYVDTRMLPFEPREGLQVTASYSRDSAMRAAKATAGAGQATSPERMHGSVLPVRTSEAIAAGDSASLVESSPTVPAPSMHSQAPAPALDRSETSREQPVSRPMPPATPLPALPAAHPYTSDAAKQSLPGVGETVLIFLGGAVALVVAAMFWRRARG